MYGGSWLGVLSKCLKTWLIVKPDFHDIAFSTFNSSSVNIRTEGRCYLGSAIGSPAFLSVYAHGMVSEWVSQLELLVSIARSHPHSAYSAFTRGLISKWTYFFRTTLSVEDHVAPLEDCIRHKFLPTLTGQTLVNENVRTVLSLPARLGDLGIIKTLLTAVSQYKSSLFTTSPLVSRLLH